MYVLYAKCTVRLIRCALFTVIAGVPPVDHRSCSRTKRGKNNRPVHHCSGSQVRPRRLQNYRSFGTKGKPNVGVPEHFDQFCGRIYITFSIYHPLFSLNVFPCTACRMCH
eukprot:COSAG02_NODE_4483_length_5304_cov_2.651297_3_plen_110_part_00